jgi:hypothetical protein
VENLQVNHLSVSKYWLCAEVGVPFLSVAVTRATSLWGMCNVEFMTDSSQALPESFELEIGLTL